MTTPPAPSCAKSGLKGPIVLGKMGQNRGVVQNLHLVAANENAVCQKKTSSELMAFPRKRILLDFFYSVEFGLVVKGFWTVFFFARFFACQIGEIIQVEQIQIDGSTGSSPIV